MTKPVEPAFVTLVLGFIAAIIGGVLMAIINTLEKNEKDRNTRAGKEKSST